MLEIRSSCVAPDCAGNVVFIPLAVGRGAIADCDICGATFQLVDGQTTLIRPPRRVAVEDF